MRRKGVLLGTVTAVLLASGMLSGCGKTEEPAPKAQVASGPRLLLQLSDTTGWHDVPAEIATLKEAQVFARIPGVLTTLAVREGDMVGKGQVIGRIVDNQLGFQAGAYGAQAAAAQAQVVQAEAELKRVQYLYDKGVYAKAKPSVLTGKPIPERPLEVLAPEALNKLGVTVIASRLTETYNAGHSTQVPAGIVFNVGRRRIARKLGFNGKAIQYEHA